jgi:hypothetical protein
MVTRSLSLYAFESKVQTETPAFQRVFLNPLSSSERMAKDSAGQVSEALEGVETRVCYPHLT